MNQSVKRKLLVLTSTFPRWHGDPVPSFVYELSKRLTDRFEVSVLAPFSEGCERVEVRDDVEVHRYKYYLGKKDLLSGTAILPQLKNNSLLWALVPSFLFTQFLAFIRLLRTKKIHAVHAHWILPQGVIAVIYKKFFNPRVRVVITAHGADVFGLRIFNPIKRWTINNCSALTVVSSAIKEEVQSNIEITKSVPVHVIPMGVDLNGFSPTNFDSTLRGKYRIEGPFLLFVGRLTEKKGLKYLIEAMPRVLEEYPAAKLLVIGHGEEQASLVNLAERLELFGKSVLFLGGMYSSALPRFYASADIFVGPSITTKSGDREGFGLVFVEALGSGCPVVTTNLPAMADIVIHERTGLIVPEKRSAEIANAIIRLLGNKELFSSIKLQCRNDVLQKFHWDTINKRYLEVLCDY